MTAQRPLSFFAYGVGEVRGFMLPPTHGALMDDCLAGGCEFVHGILNSSRNTIPYAGESDFPFRRLVAIEEAGLVFESLFAVEDLKSDDFAGRTIDGAPRARHRDRARARSRDRTAPRSACRTRLRT